ncbi:hypothetical protein ACHAW5_008819 [Stephanodiscus triporus]|uniref:Guanylate kinase-like domain-containing protein n=1 Tax=Stephanodiscus triporus TaxID=2934178 RepID=A0ABD3MYB1_9STRA
MLPSSLSLLLRGGILIVAASSAYTKLIRFLHHHRHRVVDDAFASLPALSSSLITTTTATTTATTRSSRRGGGLSSTTQQHGMIVARPLVVCGPSGVGKGTIVSRFMERQDKRRRQLLLRTRQQQRHLPEFSFSLSQTTRRQRLGEVDGVHYYFITRDYMLDVILSGRSYFIEHAEVHGNLYGTSFNAMFFPSTATTMTTSSSRGGTDDGTWMCGNRDSIGDIDVERQRILDINIAGRRSAMDDVGPILGKSRSTSQYNLGGGGGGARGARRGEGGVKNDNGTKTSINDDGQQRR